MDCAAKKLAVVERWLLVEIWLYLVNTATQLSLSSEVLSHYLLHKGGSRGRVQGGRTPPPWDDLRFSNTIGILQKLFGLLVLKMSKRRVHPLLKKILDPLLLHNLTSLIWPAECLEIERDICWQVRETISLTLKKQCCVFNVVRSP